MFFCGEEMVCIHVKLLCNFWDISEHIEYVGMLDTTGP